MGDLVALATDETTGKFSFFFCMNLFYSFFKLVIFNFVFFVVVKGQVLIRESEIKRIFAVSKSRGNFAALLVQQMYARHERITSNVMGTRGKRQLSPRRMAVVRRLAFRMYPAANEREEETIWKKECVKVSSSLSLSFSFF